MKTIALLPILFVTMILTAGCAEATPMKTVDHVDLDRYAGKWFEIAKYPNRFQRKCNEAVAEYTPLPNGKIEVHNTCKKFSNGAIKDVIGVATVKDTTTNAKLSVNFLPGWLRWTGIGNGKYWIVDLEPNYQYVVVSEPKREYLWILSRTPSLDRGTYNEILKKITTLELDVARLEFSRDQAVRD